MSTVTMRMRECQPQCWMSACGVCVCVFSQVLTTGSDTILDQKKRGAHSFRSTGLQNQEKKSAVNQLITVEALA